jgi:hypothetical protein
MVEANDALKRHMLPGSCNGLLSNSVRVALFAGVLSPPASYHERRSSVKTKTICLDGWHGHPITISEEGYEALTALVAEYRVCSWCGVSYETQGQMPNPMVVENRCLGCVVQKHQNLTFVGILGEPDMDGYQRFIFLDSMGYVYVTSTRSGDEPQRDTYQTLVYWGFPVPGVYTPRGGEEVKLYPSSWSIYGDVQHGSVVVIERSYDQKHSCTFLSSKGGEFRELTKRDSEIRALLDQAIAIVEESKDEAGWYHFGGYQTKYRRDSAVYMVVSQIASAVENVKRRLSQDIATAKQEAASDVTAS